MHKAVKFRQVDRWHEEKPDLSADHVWNHLWLKLARIAVVIMLSVIGFLFSAYLNSVHRSFESMTASIEKLAHSQEQLSVSAARVEEAIRNIERRLDRISSKP